MAFFFVEIVYRFLNLSHNAFSSSQESKQNFILSIPDFEGYIFSHLLMYCARFSTQLFHFCDLFPQLCSHLVVSHTLIQLCLSLWLHFSCKVHPHFANKAKFIFTRVFIPCPPSLSCSTCIPFHQVEFVSFIGLPHKKFLHIFCNLLAIDVGSLNR